MSSGGAHHNNSGGGSSHANSGHSGCHGGPIEKLPSLFIERPKMPRATWDALRNHILRERQRKKQEQDKTQEVLYEDDRRRIKDVSQPQMYLQPSARPSPNQQYMKPHPHMLLAQGTPSSQQQQVSNYQKRARSPSPPRAGISSAYYRTPITVATQGGPAKFNSAVASAMYGNHANFQMYPSISREEADRNKHPYLSQTTASRVSYTNVVPRNAPMNLGVSHGVAPQSADNFRGSIMAGYPRSTALRYPNASTTTSVGVLHGVPRLANVPPQTGPPQGGPPPQGMPRLYQREV
ncbi:hypothetical protein TCAL_16489 [Tigriopus californicus]|uniref:Uncharacterized protein n=1 Tax=Tigriopus californicus TaxID=6832 RepID=A0A553NUD1_TIGCA|nr:uncharacterized protein LOC131886444 [Tigriopus californicus]TRY69044.1 hypothetical protein TCAL_16489 [Tigriopus californicus]